MSGKPLQSRLQPYADEVLQLRKQNTSFRRIAEILNKKYGLNISHNAVYSFARAKTRRAEFRPKFYDGLDLDLKEGLLKQIAAVWTHGSNAIEGNTLTLGETVQVLELGLTISGKPLKDHQEAYGHARAVDLIGKMADGGKLETEQLMNLHRAVMPESTFDVMNPIGQWKREYNGTTGVIDGKTKYMEYASPADVPSLMKEWFAIFNRQLDSPKDIDAAISSYAWAHMTFVRIHPFFDGNGRMARLLANLPVLRGGWPPVLISPEHRGRYIDILWSYQSSVGVLKKGDKLLPDNSAIEEFRRFLHREWRNVIELVEEAKELQRKRR